MRVRRTHDLVALDARVRHLAGDVPVGDAHDEPVLGRVVLVLVLDDQALASEVVGLALATPFELHLIPLEVLLVLNYFHERLKQISDKHVRLNENPELVLQLSEQRNNPVDSYTMGEGKNKCLMTTVKK